MGRADPHATARSSTPDVRRRALGETRSQSTLAAVSTGPPTIREPPLSGPRHPEVPQPAGSNSSKHHRPAISASGPAMLWNGMSSTFSDSLTVLNFGCAGSEATCRTRVRLSSRRDVCWRLLLARSPWWWSWPSLLSRRAGAQWVGEPPRCCTRVEVAVDPYADGCLGIWASMAVPVSDRWIDAGEGRVCCGGAPARRRGSVTVAPTRL